MIGVKDCSMIYTRPFVTLSYAQSADGRIATLQGRAEQISGVESTNFAHTLRRDNQAVMVGIGTVLADDPQLTCRLPEGCVSPVRIILDSSLKLPTDSKIAVSAATYPTIVFYFEDNLDTESDSPPLKSLVQRRRELENLQVELIPTERTSAGCLNLPRILDKLGEMGFSSLFVEGGSSLITSFFRRNLVDRLCIVAAPLIIGRGTEAVGDLQIRKIEQARSGYTTSVLQAGNDIIWDISFSDDHDGDHDGEHDSKLSAEALYFIKPFTVALRKEKLCRHNREELIQSRVIGISHGSESHLYRNTFPQGKTQDGISGIDKVMEYPIKYGYMNAGLTSKGERVFAFFPHQDRFFYPSEELIYFPETTDFEDIVLYPSVETAYTVVLDAAPLPGDRILIIGQGMIGLLVSEILTKFTGLHAAALEPDPYRRRLSANLGMQSADPSTFTQDEQSTSIRQLFQGRLPDKIINLSGSEQGLQIAIDSAGFETLIIEASWHGNRPLELNLGENFHRKRLTIRSSQVSTLASQLGRRWNRDRRTAEVKQWLQHIGPSKYVTHRFPLSQAEEAYHLIFGPSDGSYSSHSGQPALQALLIPDTEYRAAVQNKPTTKREN